jgi:hypothetical protein
MKNFHLWLRSDVDVLVAQDGDQALKITQQDGD